MIVRGRKDRTAGGRRKRTLRSRTEGKATGEEGKTGTRGRRDAAREGGETRQETGQDSEEGRDKRGRGVGTIEVGETGQETEERRNSERKEGTRQ
ncbi:hypothetical protein PoB_005955100 [Plakobranchus ocellatus]|uniref:Uncharacterized protein n=1 Tax=Plakobranchus ocellatus TaxID=259542 RepID=A0AAV4CMF2_9GAST|nr:hypothetical protein PoB_005955100 [Plakobranchus ocellatus]